MTRVSRWTVVSCLSLLLVLPAPAVAQQPDDASLDQLITRATWYVLEFVDKLSSVVAEEHYVQDSNVMLATIAIPGPGSPAR